MVWLFSIIEELTGITVPSSKAMNLAFALARRPSLCHLDTVLTPPLAPLRVVVLDGLTDATNVGTIVKLVNWTPDEGKVFFDRDVILRKMSIFQSYFHNHNVAVLRKFLQVLTWENWSLFFFHDFVSLSRWSMLMMISLELKSPSSCLRKWICPSSYQLSPYQYYLTVPRVYV